MLGSGSTLATPVTLNSLPAKSSTASSSSSFVYFNPGGATQQQQRTQTQSRRKFQSEGRRGNFPLVSCGAAARWLGCLAGLWPPSREEACLGWFGTCPDDGSAVECPRRGGGRGSPRRGSSSLRDLFVQRFFLQLQSISVSEGREREFVYFTCSGSLNLLSVCSTNSTCLWLRVDLCGMRVLLLPTMLLPRACGAPEFTGSLARARPELP